MKRSIAFLLLTFLLSACSSSSAPTGNGSTITPTGQTITGTVSDTSGAPISGVTVTLELALTYSAAPTNAQGTYEIPNIPAGTYPIKAAMRFYTTDSATVVVTAGANSTQNFTMRLAPIPPDPTLVAYYQFNGDAGDASGKHHDGTTAGCIYMADRFNHPQSAIHFDGSSDLVTIPDAQDLNFGDSSNFTICFWMMTDGFQSSTAEPLMKWGTFGNSHGYRVEMLSGLLRGYVTTDITTNLVQTSAPSSGSWHFVTLVGNGSSDILTLWIDGVQTSNGNASELRGSSINTLPLQLGYEYQGALDDVRIYRRALSPDDISTLFNEH